MDGFDLPADVLAYYGAGVEDERLATDTGPLELERTKELIRRHLPPGANVADVGGGTGRYAGWLVEDGHTVELVDPVPLHAERARRRAGEPPRFGIHAADARALPFRDESFDVVLLLGPLYHLGDRGERLRALREAARVCRPGGLVFAAAISRFGPLLDMIRRGLIADERVFANVQDETRTGRRVAPERRMSPFPDGYFHLPGELERELEAAGLEVSHVYGIEGPGWLMRDFDAMWRDETRRERILAAARLCETDPNVRALSAHLLAVARKSP